MDNGYKVINGVVYRAEQLKDKPEDKKEIKVKTDKPKKKAVKDGLSTSTD